jgi:hypothetical protein
MYRGDEQSQTLDTMNIFVRFVHNEGVSVHFLKVIFDCIQVRLGHDLPGTASEGIVRGPARIVRHPPKLAPEEVMRRWVTEWYKEGVAIDPEELSLAQRKVGDLPRRWVVERTFSWLGQNRRMSKDYETLLAATS